MSDYEQTRVQLSDRRRDFLRRLSQIENDLERHAATDDAPAGAAPDPAGAVLTDFTAALTRELGLIESALRRIDSREYDCCLQCGGTIERERLERLPYLVNCEPCSRDFPVEYIHQLRGTHSSLRRSIFTVLHVIDATIQQLEAEAPPQSVASAVALVADLGRQLPARFEMEERGGHLAEALAAAPRFTRRATELMKEHAVFTRRIDAIVKDAEGAGASAPAWSAVHTQFRLLALDLLAHEQAEANIVESAFLDDLGGVD